MPSKKGKNLGLNFDSFGLVNHKNEKKKLVKIFDFWNIHHNNNIVQHFAERRAYFTRPHYDREIERERI